MRVGWAAVSDDFVLDDRRSVGEVAFGDRSVGTPLLHVVFVGNGWIVVLKIS